MLQERTRTRTSSTVVVVLVVVVVVAAAVALTAYLRSPGERLTRAANDLNSLPGVESARVDTSTPTAASRGDVDVTADRVAVQLRPAATHAQVVTLIERAARQTTAPDRDRIFYISTGRATTCVCDDTTDAATTVAAELLALRAVRTGEVYVYDDTSVGLDPPADRSGRRTSTMTRDALDRLARAGVAMPRAFRTYNGRVQLDATSGTPAQLSAVLGRSGDLLDRGWLVRWLSGNRLSFVVPPGVSLAETRARVRQVADALAGVRRGGTPLVQRVVASSADESAYADVDVR